jgi:putative spermidine/putrescine transport system ATP-binding protein
MLEEGEEAPRGMTVEPGTVEQVVYVGMSTRYIVRLERGEQLVAVRQNMDAPGQALRYEGRRVRLAWVPGHTYVLDHHGARGDSAAGD